MLTINGIEIKPDQSDDDKISVGEVGYFMVSALLSADDNVNEEAWFIELDLDENIAGMVYLTAEGIVEYYNGNSKFVFDSMSLFESWFLGKNVKFGNKEDGVALYHLCLTPEDRGKCVEMKTDNFATAVKIFKEAKSAKKEDDDL